MHYSHHFEDNIKHLEMLRRRAAAEAVGFGTRRLVSIIEHYQTS